MTTQDYSDKGMPYFGRARTEIDALLPPVMHRVLEIGCGAGATLAWLKGSRGAGTTVGIELVPAAAALAQTRADIIITANAETMAWPEDLGLFDLVLCLDVLEHMVDPWRFLATVGQRIRPGGRVIASIPNARHVKLLWPLVVHGRWDYQDEGILDRTHLRFFTEFSAKSLMTVGGLQIERVISHMPGPGSKTNLVNRLSLGMLRPFFVVQFLIAASKPGSVDPITLSA